MNIMVSREECIATINDFLKTKDLKQVVTLFNYLCELKGQSNAEEVGLICGNPTLLSFLLPKILDSLMQELKINKITDRNNNLITVF